MTSPYKVPILRFNSASNNLESFNQTMWVPLQNSSEYAYSVTDFGAVGDGIADDTAAFQAALDAANISPNIKSVFVPNPPVGYMISSTLFIDAGILIFGQNTKGNQQSRIFPAPTITTSIIQSRNFGVDILLRIQIIGLFFDGSSTTYNAIELNCQESLIRDCTIKNCYTYGIHIVGIDGTHQALNNSIEDCYLAGSGATSFYDGIFLDYHTADTSIKNTYVEQCQDANIRSRAYNDIIIGNHLYNGANVLYFSETSDDKTIIGNYLEDSSKEAIFINGGATDDLTLNGTITGNTFRNINTGASASGVMVIQSTDISSLVITANVVRCDASAGFSTAYFVYFNSIIPTRTKVFGNNWESGLITTSETNIASAALSAVLDDYFGTSNGSLIYRNSSVWIALSLSTLFDDYFGTTPGSVPYRGASLWSSSPILNPDGSYIPPAIADSSAINNSVYYSTTQTKLVYKDSSGVVHDLYA